MKSRLLKRMSSSSKVRTYRPFILGSGLAGKAIAEALSLLSVQNAGLHFEAPTFLGRDELPRLKLSDPSSSLLFIANPSGLHAHAIVDGARVGFPTIFAEKPACVTEEELSSLEALPTRVAVLHVYREMWGPQFVRELVETGALGQVFALESRYWQPSAAHRAVTGAPTRGTWKNSPELCGACDALLDLGSHWIDMMCFVSASTPQSLKSRLLYPLSEAPHRDTHVQFQGTLMNGASLQGSVSKVVHGSANDFEVVVMGTQGTARWNFMNPDQVLVGKGRDASLISRKGAESGTGHPPYHAMGWIEGYVALIRKVLSPSQVPEKYPVPQLSENLKLLKFLMSGERIL
jgi:predicted dehydrogenase